MHVDSILRRRLNFGERVNRVHLGYLLVGILRMGILRMLGRLTCGELGIFASFTRKMQAYSKRR